MANRKRDARPGAGHGRDFADRSATKAHLVGGGIGSLAAAAFMIRDAGLPGENLTIYETLPILGGSLDGMGNAKDGYSMRGGRMLTTDNYECTWWTAPRR